MKLLTMTTLAFFLAGWTAERAYAQKARAGEYVEFALETAHPYLSGKELAGPIHTDVVGYPGATFISVHFAVFDLAPGDYVIVKSPDGAQQHRYSGLGRDDLGRSKEGFFAAHIKGDVALVELYAVGGKSGYGYEIDFIGRGYNNEEIQEFWDLGLGEELELPEPQTLTESLCTTDDSREAKCYQTSEATAYDRSRAVVRLLITKPTGQFWCTGWLLGCDGHVMTNQHCIENQTQASNTDFEFMAEGASCAVNCQFGGACSGTLEATGSTIVSISSPLDYTLVLPATATDLPATYGFLRLRAAGAVVDERIYIPQHPSGWGKRLALESTYPDDVGGFPLVASVTEFACSGGPGDVGYWADTRGGSSGSPVLAYDDHRVVALHHCRGSSFCATGNPGFDDPNRGVPVGALINHLGANLPTCAVSVDLRGQCFYDAAMLNPVNPVTVEVINLTSGASQQAATTNNAYSLTLEPGVDIAAGDTLRLIAKDGVNFINVTDHTLTQAEIDAGALTLDLVLDEYYLDVVDFPFYEADLPNPDRNTGPAVAQMTLNYIYWDTAATPTPPLTFPDQATLYAYGIANNENPALPYFDTVGMLRTIQDNRLTPYNFSIQQDADGNEMLKVISKWISYAVPAPAGHPQHVPGAIPAYGGYANWMAIRGIHTDQVAFPMPNDLDVFGFWINDPYPSALGGIGENSYKTANELLSTYYLPLATGDSYDGQYVAVCEPPGRDPSKRIRLKDSKYRFDQPTKDLLSYVRSLKKPPANLVADANRKIVASALSGVAEQLSPYDEAFRNRIAKTSAGTPLFVARQGGGDYYLVPLEDKATAAVIIVDAEEGFFKEASWVESSVSYPAVSEAKALDLVLVALDKYGMDRSLIKNAETSLYLEGGNPYHPDWRITVGDAVFAIDPFGHITMIDRR